MKLEQQVASLELSKKLKELGVKQESYFWWVNRTTPPYDQTFWHVLPLLKLRDEAWDVVSNECSEDDHVSLRALFAHYEIGHFSAFTVAELGEMLPEEIELDEVSCFISISRGLRSSWAIGYRPNGSVWVRYTEASTEADARALMLVYLIENKLFQLP